MIHLASKCDQGLLNRSKFPAHFIYLSPQADFILAIQFSILSKVISLTKKRENFYFNEFNENSVVLHNVGNNWNALFFKRKFRNVMMLNVDISIVLRNVLSQKY